MIGVSSDLSTRKTLIVCYARIGCSKYLYSIFSVENETYNRLVSSIMGPFPQSLLRCHATAGAGIVFGPVQGYQGMLGNKRSKIGPGNDVPDRVVIV
jgi:hypothetical protein